MKLSLDYTPRPEVTAHLIDEENLHYAVEAVKERVRLSPVILILLGGDRISCCDEGVLIYDNEDLASIATIAPNGEENSGQPTIVALYTLPKFRKKGLGAITLRRTVERCLERGFSNIRTDVLSQSAMRIIRQLPVNLQENMDVRDCGGFLDQLSSLEH